MCTVTQLRRLEAIVAGGDAGRWRVPYRRQCLTAKARQRSICPNVRLAHRLKNPPCGKYGRRPRQCETSIARTALSDLLIDPSHRKPRPRTCPPRRALSVPPPTPVDGTPEWGTWNNERGATQGHPRQTATPRTTTTCASSRAENSASTPRCRHTTLQIAYTCSATHVCTLRLTQGRSSTIRRQDSGAKRDRRTMCSASPSASRPDDPTILRSPQSPYLRPRHPRSPQTPSCAPPSNSSSAPMSPSALPLIYCVACAGASLAVPTSSVLGSRQAQQAPHRF